ncbi:SDR family NAD(P)-dependent oxidoreductase [Mycolicibacterium holsaticum]|uniref:Oxidoreductase n=1 Tax=Mycolicibacterium holsaticum TaxID=152142 RepID=A0A1E3RTR2_9MYCO|nr:SDR family oxidoreductase [Mycolicibacterium holsaticum]MDA4109694.1 oxidoreductase [Mycolicibacterium holsaticum DSM 44478 = JCM 12374]ODQ92777.1 oxidoreductase [Mycolicibacterium holsaticum]QZA10625.1 SDR family oxidoreductase [Mycolicibacterium holsaticum DSM 44478 = JCM 12374]UNC11871.1 SDR family oxidoreductase [Mycolicibacterium holsaticum DSM 44478 = JCM 12374]
MTLDFAQQGRTAFDLSGKVVVVIGGGQMPGEKTGNGRATAILAARHGAEVVAVDLNLAAAQETVDLITAEGGKAYAVQADVAEKEDCQRIFDTVMQRSGRVDGMVYSVATNPPFDREDNSMTVEAFNYGVNVNMLGCYHCNLFAAQCMEKNAGTSTGSIVNFSSIASVKNEIGLNMGIMPYALGKCGLNYITELTAVQYAEAGIRANTLMLGPIDSTLGNHDSQELFGLDPDEVDAAYRDVVKLKMGRASTWETAYAALYLLADESRFMTGQQIRLDGGATLVR